MSSENQTNIRFSLKETVWFQKGQEVKEVRSLSLNPDITIQQFEEYVQVKGVLTLEGNYTPDLSNQGDYYSLRELAPSRMIENVIVLEDGSCEMNHQFPVDISIPLTRITDLENLCVSVETFDYQLAEKGSIQIAADLCISGLHDHNRAVETYQEQRGYEQYNSYPFENEYRSNNEGNAGYEYQEEREQEEQFQFFHQPTSEQETSEQDNLYGSDWIQSLEENDEQEEQDTYPGQPTYLEVFQPEEVVEDRVEAVENENEVEQYYELEESNEQSYEEEQQGEEHFNVEIMAQSEQLEEQSEAQEEEEYEEVFRGFNISAEAMEPQAMEPQAMEPQAMEPQAMEPQAVDTTPSFLMNNNDVEASQNENDAQVSNNENNTYNERPSFLNNDFNVHNYLNNSLNSRPSFLDNDFSTLQNANNENNAQKEIEKYEELYNRTLEQNYQPYVNQQYQQAPFAYNQNQQQQQQFYQNPFPQVNQENNFENPNDVRQTPPYYADYYQAQVEQQEAPPELPKVEVKAEPVVNKEVKEEVSEARSVKSDNLLSSLFTGEGREDSYTKLKLYLAQNGDTIESVAKKYNLQTQQLNRVNNLNDEFLSEGQIIYIPVTAIKQ
ncbi:stage VI sporulation protein D [Bacillus sp. AFS088145]|uniref:stage VI sporulation protein D n=1 Tax=Bacillus sp. AFS088145 TaxID=2033514 RepID=UPI000BF7EC3F|nr:stage VI sporulation protein D [Bacillus sp. AFS088145]PFH90248.1 stage VI sporulation protein D [Bacillus sp. AFS088145]